MAERREADQFIEHILQLEEKLDQALRPLGPQQWLRMNCTIAQLKTMLLLFADGPTRMSVLSSRLGTSLSTTSGIVERLVKQGFVLRANQPGDRRVVICKLSQRGQKVMDRLWESRRIWTKSFLKRIAAEKLQVIAEAMEAILEAITTVKEDSPPLTIEKNSSHIKRSRRLLSSERRIESLCATESAG